MHHSLQSKKNDDDPSANGGLSFWLWSAAALILTAGIVHWARPATSATTTPLAQRTPAAQTIVRSEPRQKIVSENSQANLFSAFVRDFEHELDPNKREDIIAELLVKVTTDEIPAVLEFLQTARPADLAQDISKRLIRQWTDKYPEAAAAWIEMLSAEKQTALLDDVAIVWANNGLTNAMNWAESLHDNDMRCHALQVIADEAVRSQPLLALQIAINLPQYQQRDDLIRRGAMQWASEDAESAASWVEQLPQGDLRNEALSGIAIVWSASEPVSAATLALKELPPGRLLEDTVVSIVERWAQTQPEAAANWVEQFPRNPVRYAAMDNLINLWMIKDSQAAQQWQAAHSTLQPP